MKKLVLLVVLLIAGSAVAGYYFAPASMPAVMHPEGRACGRMASLCGGTAQDCEEAFSELRKISGPEAIRQPISCVMSAGTCPEAAGCLAGGGLKAIMKTGGEFLKGVGKSLGE